MSGQEARSAACTCDPEMPYLADIRCPQHGATYDGGTDELATAGDVGEGGHPAVEAEAAADRVSASSGREVARPSVPDPVARSGSAASSDDVTLGDIEEQEMWEEHTRERVEQMRKASSAARSRP